MKSLKRISSILIFFILFSQAAIASSIEWHNYDEGMALAKTQEKPVMISFYSDRCGYCKKLGNETYSDPGIISLSENFVNIKVDSDAQGKLASNYGVRFLPTIVFTDSKGSEIYRQVGYTDANGLETVMEAVLEGNGLPPTQTPGFSLILSLFSFLLITIFLGNRMRK